MAIQNDNTLVTKGDLKSLYTDKIAPYLGGGISYYYTDRTGEELKSIDMRLSASQTVNAGSTQNTLINFDKSSGTYETNNHKVIIPAGQRIQINVALQASPGASNAVDGEWQIYDYTNDIIISKANFTYIGSGYSWSSTKSVQYTAPENGALVGVKVTALFYNTSVTASSSFTIQEIGRIVDPIKYMDNNSDLEETPVGNIISYMGNSIPKHHLACDGTEYAIGTYSELEAHIIKEFGSINYFGGDGTTTWAVPDLNGEFLRGTGTNSHTNQGNGADVGVHQDSTEFPAYYTGIGADNKYYIGFRVPNNVTSSDYNIISKADKNISKTSTSIYGNAKEDLHGTASTSNVLSTIRPTNTSVKFCIKYESTYHVIVPSHMYKVNATFDLTWNSTDQAYILNTFTYKAGDQSLIDGNVFKAPLTGWYNISFNSGQVAKTTKIMQYLHIVHNGTATIYTDGSNSDTNTGWWGLDINRTFYLEKGDTVYARVWTEGQTITLPTNMNASFCLLTANHKDNIIAGGEVYSTEEQEIGTWTDGKKLYQKTIAVTSQPTINTWGSGYEIGASVDTIVKVTGRLVLDNNAGTYVGNTTWPITTDDDYINYIGTDNRHPSLPNRVGVKVGKQGYTSRPVTITVQYTKTTDTANQYTYKNSLLLTRPDLWDVGVEYDFGGGLYGKRIMDTSIDVASGNTVQPSIAASGVTAIVSYGGMYGNSSSAMAGFGAPIVIRTSSTIAAESAPQIGGTGGLVARICNINWTTNINKYDVWVTYRKA